MFVHLESLKRSFVGVKINTHFRFLLLGWRNTHIEFAALQINE